MAGDVAIYVGPCDWPVSRCGDGEDFDNYGGDEASVPEVEATAKIILWAMTGRRFGLCPVEWSTPPICECSCACTCRGCSVALPGPVNSIISVVIDDEEVDPDTYIIQNDRLMRAEAWPRVFTVDYLRGIAPPAGAGLAVEQLAREVMAAKCRNDACRLPTNLRSRSRNGDTIELGEIKEGKTNIPLVDMWVTAVNGIALPSETWTPDIDPEQFLTPAVVIS